jgi:hypothetical protein
MNEGKKIMMQFVCRKSLSMGFALFACLTGAVGCDEDDLKGSLASDDTEMTSEEDGADDAPSGSGGAQPRAGSAGGTDSSDDDGGGDDAGDASESEVPLPSFPGLGSRTPPASGGSSSGSDDATESASSSFDDKLLTELTPSEAVSLCEDLSAADRAAFHVDRLREIDCLVRALGVTDSPAACERQLNDCMASGELPEDPELYDLVLYAQDLEDPAICEDASFENVCSASVGPYRTCYIDTTEVLERLYQAPLEIFSCDQAGDEPASLSAGQRFDDFLEGLEDPASCLDLPEDCEY